MGTDFGRGFRMGIGDRKGALGDKCSGVLDSQPASDTVVVPSAQTRMSPPTTPDMASLPQSRQTSTEHASEAAPEIVVWTEDMEVESESAGESDDQSSVVADTK